MAALLAGIGFPLGAAEFAAPAEGPVAFRRDKVPLDADAMAGLSKQLETLARGLNAETPADRRGAAQMLATALALDPANAGARELISEYLAGTHQPAANAEKLEQSRARIWQYISWLETPDAGREGQALAACLKDVIIVADPKNPKSGELRNAGEKGAWAGWVPAISAYESKSLAATEGPKATPPTTPASPPSDSFLEQAQVHTMLWQTTSKDESAIWTLAPAPLRMTAVKLENDAGKHQSDDSFSLSVGAVEHGGSLNQMSNTIRDLLKKQHPVLPRGLKVTITSKELEKSLESKKRQSISAACAVLASSAITGREPDAIIIGQLDEAGAFKLPTSFWDQLQSLGKGGGRRLVLPSEASSYLFSVLALEKPEFFMEYEVLLAADFKQLLELSAKTPAPPLANAIAEFRKIRERAGSQDVRQYIANTFVKQRLMAILQDAPFHMSAKLLLIQAAGNRPTLVARPVLAAEIRRALEPMVWILSLQDRDLSSSEIAKIGQTYELCRTRVEGLERYAEKNDRGLVEQARGVVIAIRNLDRATRTRGEGHIVMQAIHSTHTDLCRLAKTVSEQLAVEAGDGLAPPNR